MKKNSKNNAGFILFLRAGAGFTLIELLLGFLIFSIVLTVLYSTFFSGMKVEERSAGDAAAYHQAKMSLDMMGHELEEAVPFTFVNIAPSLASFEGDRTKISFLTPKKDGLKRVSYYLKDKEKVKVYQTLLGAHYTKNVRIANIREQARAVFCLVRSEEPFFDFLRGAAGNPAAEEILFDDVREGSFQISYAYLKAAGDSSSLVWQNFWANDYIPAGIRFEMIIESYQKNDRPLYIKKDVYVPTGFWGELL